MRTVFRVILIINHRAGRGAAAARGGGVAHRRAGGAGRRDHLQLPGLWSLESSNGRAALDSRGCRPPVAAQAGGGGETSCSSRNGSRPLLARSAMQGGGRAIFASYSKPPRRNRRRRATRSRRPDCPRRECVPPRRDTLRDSADGTRLEGRGSAARLALVAEASPSKSRAWLSPQLSR